MIERAPIIDFHAHILPHADHGSKSTKESLDQLAIMNRCGVDTVVATPHFYPNTASVSSFLELVNFSAERLAPQRTKTPNIIIGSEVLYCEGLDHMDQLDALCVRGTQVLLLELPISEWNSELFYTVERLTHRFTVVLAHIDRYIKKQSDEIARLLDMGALAQINATSLSSLSTRHKLSPLLTSDRVVALGSDLHKTEQKSCRALVSAQKKLGGLFDEIMERSQHLLRNAERLQ